jgi:Polyketide cyclase / dehydrase and lipid transport
MTNIFVSSIVAAPATKVWAKVRDFNGLPSWLPAVAESRIENNEPSDKVGCVRAFTLRNGDRLREQLLSLSDHELFLTYKILESPMGVEGYVATLRLTPVTEGDRTFLEWTAEFECDPAREAELINTIAKGMFQGGFESLKRQFNKSSSK